MSHQCLSDLKGGPRDVFYFTALKYGHYLWQQGHAGRSLLALTRALYTDLPEEAPIYQDWPLPYAAIHWIVASHSSHDFPGNPRISFQHQATRIRGLQAERKRARAWAVWALICRTKPELPGDPAQGITEPSIETIEQRLKEFGSLEEASLWRSILD